MSALKPCLFLDRDGVIIENVPYTRDPDKVVLRKGIIEVLQAARQKGFLVICVTNQSGIGHGLLTLEDYAKITARLEELLLQHGSLKLDAIYFSPYFEQAQDPRFLQNKDWRKPEIGMFCEAAKNFPIDFERSIMIGDRTSDLEAAQDAKVGKKILLRTSDFPDEIKNIPSGIVFSYARELSEISL